MQPIKTFGEDSIASSTDDEEDVKFIEEIVASYQKNEQEDERVQSVICEALRSRPGGSEEDTEDIMLGLRVQHDNYQKILTYAEFLIE